MNKIIKKAAAIVTALAVFVTMAVFDVPKTPTAEAAVTPTVSVKLGTLKTYTQSSSDKDSIALSSLTSSSNWSKSLSGNTITLKESDKYKTYNVGYVPIIASVTVPANTSYRTTMHFNLTGSPNKSSSSSTATAFVELFDLGTSNISSGITFRTPSKDDKNKEQFSDSRTLGRDIRETKDFTSSGSVSILFENTSSTEKTISHYFGFFSGCRYGSKYTHQVEAKCALSFDKLVDGDTVSPQISYSSADARYITYYREAIATLPVIKSFSKDQFYPDVASSSLNRDDFIKMVGGRGEYHDNGDPPYGDRSRWDQKFKLSGNTNKLVFAVSKCSTGEHGKLAYVPFTVPIKVPAYTERTYYLTFEINFVKNSATGAGFFGELIEGGVPDSFNTADSANMTGNTKLRVFTSDTGNKTQTFSGTVTLPLTLKNDTGSAKTLYGNYVYFVGYCHVGAYEPTPRFELTLTDIGYASYEDDHYAEINASNCTYTHNQTITPGSDYNATITANTGYSLPSTITVKCGGTTMATSKYTWNSSTGKLTIASKNITGGITVTANGVPNKYSITYSGLDGASLSTKPTTHTYGTATTIGNPTKTGYTFAGWKVNGGSSATKSLSLGATSFTANITLEASWTINKYNATLSGTNVSTSSGFGTNAVTYNTAWTGKFTANTGYDLPSSITVTVGGTTLTSSQYTYSTSGSTGTVSIDAANVTGAVAVSAGGTAKTYSITYSGLTGASLSTKPTTHTYGTATTVGNPSKTGYTFAGWKVNGGSTATKSLSLGATAYTANITLEATWTANTYSATFSGTNTASSSGFGTGKVTYNTAWTGKFSANTGYDLPSSVTVKVGSTTLTSSQYTYTTSGSTGTVTISAANVTGAVTVTAVGTAKKYDATLSGTNVTASTGFGTGKVTYKTAWTGYITAASGYVLPDTITVKVGSTTLTSSQYTYTKSTGKITITAANVTGAITVTATGHKHSYTSEVTTAATCTSTGVRTYTCACGYSYTSTISKTAHTYSDAWTTSTTQHWHVCTKCNTAGTKSSHTWNSGVVTKEPTETSTGVKTITCTTCSATKNETIAMLEHTHNIPDGWNGHDDDEHWRECEGNCGEKVDPEAHTLEQTDHKDPTCTEEGYTKYVCKVCNNEIIKVIETTEHDFGDDWKSDSANHYHVCKVCGAKGGTAVHKWNSGTVEQFPDCTHTGVRVSECTVCGAVSRNDIAVDNNAHDWGDWVIFTAPTDANKGVIQSVCNTDPAHTKTDEIPALSDNSFWKSVDSTEATCTEGGTETYECEYGRVTAATSPNGHSPKTDGRIEPTCVSTGLTEGSHCDICGEVLDEQEIIGILGHEWDTDNARITIRPSCTEKGSKTVACKRCDATYSEDVSATGHTKEAVSAVPATCTETGLTEGEHCAVCEAVIVEQEVVGALGHNWGEGVRTKEPGCTDDGVMTFTCTRCPKTKTEDIYAVGHTKVIDNAVAPTCTTKGKTEGSHCPDCGRVFKAQENIPALGHNWNDGIVTIEPKEDEPGEKTYTCTVCGEEKTEPIAPLNHKHDWDTEWSSDDTYHWHDCLNGCDEKNDEAAHKWDNGNVAKPPTATEEGEKTFECTVCGETKTETIPVTDDIDEGKISKEVRPGENVPNTTLETPLDDLVDAVLTSAEQETTKDGFNIKIILTVEDATNSVSAKDKAAVEKALGGMTNYKPGQYLDVNLFKVINGERNPITETKATLTITFEVPAGLRGNSRTYSVIRVHGGKTTVLNDLDSDPNTVTIKTDKFSTYALTYREKTTSSTPSGSGSGDSGSRPSRPSTSGDNTSSDNTSSDSTSSDNTSSDTTLSGSTSGDNVSSGSTSSDSTSSDNTSSDTTLSGSTSGDNTSSSSTSSDTTSSGSTSGDNTSSSSTSGDNASSGSTSGDNTLSGSNSTSDESTHNPSENSPSDGTDNPATGIAISFVPLAAVFAALPLIIKRRRR